MKTTLNLDGELLTQAKRLAEQQDITLTAVIENAIREALSCARQIPTFRLELPTVQGKDPAFVDPSDRAALYDAMEGRSISPQ
ncbi:MAG: type II toxin-antitoxin system VapB family antitoxin [Actinomycetota bacterium]